MSDEKVIDEKVKITLLAPESYDPGEVKTKVMISQPMAGKSIEEIKATRDRAKLSLLEAGYDFQETLLEGDWTAAERMAARGVLHRDLAFLARVLGTMARCDVVYFCDGWEEARGCRIEHAAAEAYGLTIIEEDFKEASA